MMGTGKVAGFGDRVAERVAERRSQLVLGLDPDPARLWPEAHESAGGADHISAPPGLAAARAVAAHCRLVLRATAEHCVGVKLQLACFERLGPSGWACLYDVAALAREHGLLVIADAKRGDIDVSARAYAEAFLGTVETPWGSVAGLGADAMTVNPLLGFDSLEPMVEVARENAGGLFVLARTSNPGAADLQELPLRDGGTVSTRIAHMVASLGEPGIGSRGLSDVGAVIGATAPQRLREIRAALPAAVLLLPGVGAQGGRVADLGPAWASGPGAALVTVSRGLVRAHESLGGDPAEAARREAGRLRAELWAGGGG